jgi:hypothetical protein
VTNQKGLAFEAQKEAKTKAERIKLIVKDKLIIDNPHL